MNNHEKDFITIDPDQSSLKEVHHLMIGGIAPRPIALVSTISENGINNLAPFSFFNAFGANPPYVAFSPAFSGRDGSAKDTYNNLKKIPECVIQVVTYDLVQQANLTSTLYNQDVDEFVKSGLTPVDSEKIQPKRVKESPFQMECLVEQIIPLGGKNGSGNLVLCRVINFHISSHILKDGQIDPQLIDLVGRHSAHFYSRASGDAVFEVKRPRGIGIGMDQLPSFIKKSEILSDGDLAKLGTTVSLPPGDEVAVFLESGKKMQLSAEDILGINDKGNYRKLFNAGCTFWETDPHKAKVLLEKSAKKALDADDVRFALLVLFAINQLKI